MRTRRWLRLLVLAMAVVIAVTWGVSGALEYGWAHRLLVTRLAETLGRPVDVGHFSFSLLSGPQLEADSVSVSEDPFFGREYFLRAEQLTATLRWTALLRGRIEFGTVSLIRPSLNLVRTPEGRWNIEGWLPPSRGVDVMHTVSVPFSSAGIPNTANAVEVVQGSRMPDAVAHIRINSGRINFKHGAEKLPFALVDVEGTLDQDAAGRWSIDIAADPMRT